jgi:hypothetical protein
LRYADIAVVFNQILYILETAKHFALVCCWSTAIALHHVVELFTIKPFEGHDLLLGCGLPDHRAEMSRTDAARAARVLMIAALAG